jgi:hypothetical protein
LMAEPLLSAFRFLLLLLLLLLLDDGTMEVMDDDWPKAVLY